MKKALLAIATIMWLISTVPAEAIPILSSTNNLRLKVIAESSANDAAPPISAIVPIAVNSKPEFTAPTGAFDLSAASYSGKSCAINTTTSTYGTTISTDGTKLFASGIFDSRVYRYDLETPFDVSTGVQTQEFNPGRLPRPQDISFNTDGTKLYCLFQYGTITEYQLSKPYDIENTTSTFTLSIHSDGAGMDFSDDGTKLYIAVKSKLIQMYHLSVPFDLSTASLSPNTLSLGSEVKYSRDVTITPEGTKLLVFSPYRGIWEYNLSSAHDLSTAVLAGIEHSFDPGNEENNAYGMAFSREGHKLYVTGIKNKVFQYDIAPSVSYPENSSSEVSDVNANNGDGGDDDEGISYSLSSGSDNDLFEINSSTGVLTIKAIPDYENPDDTNKDNIYELTIIADDGASTNNTASMTLLVSITNEIELPGTATTAPSAITITSATMGGSCTLNNGSTIIERGVVYSNTDNTPEIGEPNVIKDTNGNGAGIYTETISSLSPNTTYYFQAYATNNEGTSYGGINSFTTLKATQSISFGAIAAKTYGDADFDAAASASSGLAIAYSSSNEKVASIIDGKIHITGAGSCTIYANQAGNENYEVATQASQTLSVNKATATLELSGLKATFDSLAHAASATSSPSELNVILTYEGSSTAPTNAGSYAVVATIDDDNYSGSANGKLVIEKAKQSISFGAIAAKTYGDADFDAAASASSGLAIAYSSSNEKVASIIDGKIHITGAGSCTIYANQAGNENYEAATQAEQTITVEVPTTIKNMNAPEVNVYPSINHGKFNIEMNSNETYNIMVLDLQGKTVCIRYKCLEKEVLNLTHLNPGYYFVRIKQGQFTNTKRIIIQ